MENNHEDLLVHTGTCFPRLLLVIGYIIMFFSLSVIIALIIEAEYLLIILGIIGLAIGAFLSFNISGFQIKNGKYRSFCYLLKYKIGKWKTTKLPNISILRKTLSTRTYGGRTNISTSDKSIVYEITLLSKSHRTKEVLIRMKNKEQAISLLEKISKSLNVESCNYNPQRTRRR